MIYFLKTLYLTFLLPPGIFLIILLALSIYLCRRSPRSGRFLMLVTFLLYMTTAGWFADPLIRSLENRYTPPSALAGDAIVVLGGGATSDTPNVHGLGHVYGTSANRLLTAAQLYHEKPMPIIVSGGQVFQNTGVEAVIQKSILTGLGVPADRIFLENRSLNTTENAKFTAEILQQQGFNQPILVTSAFHMPRAVRQFEKAGISVTPYPTDYQANQSSRLSLLSFLPLADSLEKTQWALKEYLGLLAIKWY